MMCILRTVFLFCVGAAALSCEAATKPIQRQRKRLNERFGRDK